MKKIHFISAKHERNLILYTNFLYICRQKCYFFGFWVDCSVGAYNLPSLVGAKSSVSAPEPSIHTVSIFLHIAAKTAKQSHPQPLLRHGRCPGDVLRVVMGRFAGQEYSFAVSWEYMALFCAL